MAIDKIKRISKTITEYRPYVLNCLQSYLNRNGIFSKAGNLILNSLYYSYRGYQIIRNKKNISSLMLSDPNKGFDYYHKYECNSLPPLEEVMSIIKSKSIKTVSFDIFDTLLCRPSLNPTDIFYIIDGIVREKYGINFIDIRMNSEPSSPFTNIDDIYQNIHSKTNISISVLEDIKK